MEKRNEVVIPLVLTDEVEDGEVRWRWWAVATGGGASRHSQHDPRDRIRVLRWGPVAAVVNLILCALAPTSYLWCCATGAHQPVQRLDTPDQGTIEVPTWSLDRVGRRLTNILPLISFYTLNFRLNFILISFTISSQISAYSVPHRHGQSPIDLTSTIHISDLKQIL
jgi:hypothetical protein